MSNEEYDVCVIGAGTVGIYIAGLLSTAGRKVLLLEAGKTLGDQRDSILDPHLLNTNHIGVGQGWTTGFGGTSQLWGGQLWPWQDWEFGLDGQPGLRAWPLGYAELQPFYKEVLDALGLPEVHQDIHALRNLPSGQSQLHGRDLQMKFSTWMGWRHRNFARNAALKRRMRGVDVLSGPIVDRIDVLSAQRVDVHTTEPPGNMKVHVAKAVVLAAGTIGTTRILAASEVSANLPRLGSGFIDHVSKRAAAITVTDWTKFRAFASHRYHKGVLMSPRIVPTEGFVRQRGVLPSYAHFEFELAENSFPRQIREMLRARQHGVGTSNLPSMLGAAGQDLPDLVEATMWGLLNKQRPILKSSNVYLRVDVQQPVRSETRLNWLDSSADGTILDLRWRVGEEERLSADVLRNEVMLAMDSADIGASVSRLTPESEFADIFHMMGGTPMGGSPEGGVVDSNQKVFGTENVYIAGASVFPSGGLANPTLTALALTHRLGCHIGN